MRAHIHFHRSWEPYPADSELAYIGLKVVALPHFDREKVVVVLLCFSVGGVLGEEHLSYLLKLWSEHVDRE